MKLMKLFLTGALALSVLSPALTMAMEPAPRPTGPATAAEIAQAQTCVICHDDLTNGENIRTLRCNANGVPHIFHRDCINEWLFSQQRANQPSRCPMCQTPAIPELYRKEQILSHLTNFEQAHNPFNQNNRKFTLQIAAGSHITSLAVPILMFLKFKYFDKRETNSLKKVLKDLTADRTMQLFYFCNFIAEYLFAKYLHEDGADTYAHILPHGVKLAFWIIGLNIAARFPGNTN